MGLKILVSLKMMITIMTMYWRKKMMVEMMITEWKVNECFSYVFFPDHDFASVRIYWAGENLGY